MRAARPPVSPEEYAHRVKRLRDFGFKPAYKVGRKNNGAAKAAVTRAWEKHKFFLSLRPETQPVKFKKLSASELKLARKVVSKEAVTPGGIFLQVPRGVKAKDYDYTIRRGKGGITAEVVESIRGRQKDIVVRPNYRELVMNPKGHIIALVKQAQQNAPKKKVKRGGKTRMVARKLKGVKIVVGGMESTKRGDIPPSRVWQGEQSSVSEIFESFVGSEEEYEDEGEYRERVREFTDKFQLRFIYE